MVTEGVVAEKAHVEFAVLGPLEVTRGGQPLALGGPRQRAVLALLLLNADHVVSLDRIVDEVWNGKPPDGAATSVQTYVFHLRRVLEPDRRRGASGDVLGSRDHGYVLRTVETHIDARTFEAGIEAGRAALQDGHYAEAADRLRAALALWRGPVLADLTDYDFIRPEATRLDELRLIGVEARIEAELALGRHSMLVPELERLIAEYPLRENLYAQLMLAQYRCGRQSDALATYQRARGLLADELGIDPGAGLQERHQAVLAHDPGLDAPVEPQPVGPTDTAATVRRRRFRTNRRRLLAVATALALVGAAIVTVTIRALAPQPANLPANAASALDGDGNLDGDPVPIGHNPTALAYAANSVWAVNTGEDTVSRINPDTRAVVDTIDVDSSPTAIAASGDDVWVTNRGAGTVSRISTRTNRVVQTVSVGNVPDAIAVGPSGVWVTNHGDDTVSRIHPDSGTASKPIDVGAGPDGIAVGKRRVWVANGRDGTVSHIDAKSLRVSSPIPVGAGPRSIAITPSAVWVANALDLSVWKLDPKSGRVLATVPVGDGPHSVVADDNAVWVSNEYAATIHRIDPPTARVTDAIAVGSSPRGLALHDDRLWVATGPFAAQSHRGGTLTVVTGSPPDPFDPAAGSNTQDANAMQLLYDGLVRLRESGGIDGLTLVPNLATSLPRPTSGGRTYTFTLRPGVRYSTGATVRASDFLRGAERAVAAEGDWPSRHYTNIVGGPKCHSRPAECDLSRGVVADDADGTVTFHLTEPDPDFLDKLMVFIVPTPRGTPIGKLDGERIPSTGPYKISTHTLGKALTLVRNPYFREWSYAARPDGYPDVIRWQRVNDTATQLARVQAGTADLVSLSWDRPQRPEAVDELAVRYPDRLHSHPGMLTGYFALNTRAAPFDDPKVRQALNYAIDRRRAVALWGGPRILATTCQVIPAGFPAYRRHCPYTANPSPDGAYHGPDLERAKKLVAASQSAGVRVGVWGAEGDPLNHYLVGVLRQLGYHPGLTTRPADTYWTEIEDSRNHGHIFLAGWGADFPVAANFFLPTLTCASYKPESPINLNFARYCNPAIDEFARTANTTQLTDPARARELWTALDQRITHEAPRVPLWNSKWTTFVSDRLGNYQADPWIGPLLGQMWVQ